jgi:predicted nucleic acid-binding protein
VRQRLRPGRPQRCGSRGARPAQVRSKHHGSAGQILGGPAYDALIAFTSAKHNATLMSLDQREAATYETVGAQVEQLLG